MKNKLFALIAVSFFTFPAFAQNNPIKDYPLRDYIASEIEYRLMDLGTGMSLRGRNGFEQNNAENNFNGNLSLHYYEYLNLKNVQRIENTGTYLGFYYVKDFDSQVPTPFWNSVSYSSRNISSLRDTNDNISFPVYGNDYPANGIAYGFNFSLRYAIF